MPTLLVIDDNESVRYSLQFVFTGFGFTVECAASGTAAFALCDQQRFDVALIDIFMPGMNGIDVCRELRAHVSQSGRDLPVWLMTGAFTADLERRGAAVGAMALLPKPFDVVTLEREIRNRLATPPLGVA